jgi:hypothetical protein
LWNAVRCPCGVRVFRIPWPAAPKVVDHLSLLLPESHCVSLSDSIAGLSGLPVGVAPAAAVCPEPGLGSETSHTLEIGFSGPFLTPWGRIFGPRPERRRAWDCSSGDAAGAVLRNALTRSGKCLSQPLAHRQSPPVGLAVVQRVLIPYRLSPAQPPARVPDGRGSRIRRSVPARPRAEQAAA